MEVIALLKKALAIGASDIHLTVGTPPVFRINGNLIRLEETQHITQTDTFNALSEIMNSEQFQIWQQLGELEFSYSLPGIGRFRVNAYRQRGCTSLAIRPVPYVIPSFEELQIPFAAANLAEKKQGLVLVTGQAGSGKSTTMAALINKINQERSSYVITIEDPIEYLHHHQKSIVDQREIGGDTRSVSAALRSCLRHDPDVIMIGDMTDQDTVLTVLEAAEAGHLLFASLNTCSAIQSIQRIIEMFPPAQQEQIRQKLASVLQGVISQKLYAGIAGRELAVEVLIATTAVRSLIREGKIHQLTTVMQTGGRWGMQTMEMSLNELIQNGKINQDSNPR